MNDQRNEDKTITDPDSELTDDDLENVAGGVRAPRPRSSADPQEGGEIV